MWKCPICHCRLHMGKCGGQLRLLMKIGKLRCIVLLGMLVCFAEKMMGDGIVMHGEGEVQ